PRLARARQSKHVMNPFAFKGARQEGSCRAPATRHDGADRSARPDSGAATLAGAARPGQDRGMRRAALAAVATASVALLVAGCGGESTTETATGSTANQTQA